MVLFENKRIVQVSRQLLIHRTLDMKNQKEQKENLQKLRTERSETKAQQSVAALRESAISGNNLMPNFIDCAQNYVSLGEMIQVLKEEFGEYREAAVF